MLRFHEMDTGLRLLTDEETRQQTEAQMRLAEERAVYAKERADTAEERAVTAEKPAALAEAGNVRLREDLARLRS